MGKRLKQVGPGIHHVTFGVDDIRVALNRVREAGVTVIGESPRIGAGGSLVAFLHPKDTGGVLIELVERPKQANQHKQPLQEGSPVLIYLKDPSEKLWGVLHNKDVSGITASAIDLSSFDNWISQLERGDEDVVGPAMLFFPMHRVERILLDEGSGGLESLADRFKRRLGKHVHDYVG